MMGESGAPRSSRPQGSEQCGAAPWLAMPGPRVLDDPPYPCAAGPSGGGGNEARHDGGQKEKRHLTVSYRYPRRVYGEHEECQEHGFLTVPYDGS